MTAERLTEPFPGGLGSTFKLMQCWRCNKARAVRQGWHGGYLTCEWCGEPTPHKQVNLQRLRDSITWLIDQMGRLGVKVGVCEDDYLTEQGVTYFAGIYGSREGADEAPSFEVRLHRDVSPWGLDLALHKAWIGLGDASRWPDWNWYPGKNGSEWRCPLFRGWGASDFQPMPGWDVHDIWSSMSTW